MSLFHILVLCFISQTQFSSVMGDDKKCIFAPEVYSIFSGRKHPQLGPPRSVKYNPNYGFAPYWPGGDWVFARFDTTTEKRLDSACGADCSILFVEFGEICARNLYYVHKTFKNYCALLNEDCTGREKWLIAYRGKCQEDLKTYPTNRDVLVTRAQKYIDDFEANNPSTQIYRVFKGHRIKNQ